MYRFRSRGVAATEAVLAFGLLLFVILLLWSLARIVYEQTNLETATRFAAQAALASYIQNAPIVCTDDDVLLGGFSEDPRSDKCFEARRLAGQNALSVLDINTDENPTRSLASESDFQEEGGSSTGGYGSMTTAVLSEDDPMFDGGAERLDVQCALLQPGQITPAFPAEGEDGCALDQEEILTAQAVIFRITVQASGDSIDQGFLGEVIGLLGDFGASSSAYGLRRLNE